MRLLILSNFYPPHTIGGMEYRCQETVQGLRKRGHSVQVLTSRHGVSRREADEAVVEREESDARRVLYLESDLNYYRPGAFFLLRRWQERLNLNQLRRALEDTQPDLVMVWGLWNLSRWLPYWAEQWLPGRVAYSIASYWPMEATIHEEYWRSVSQRRLTNLSMWPFRRLALHALKHEGYPPSLQFSHAVCCSPALRATLVQAGRLPDHAHVIYSGIDPAPYVRDPGDVRRFVNEATRLLYFGSLAPHKGVETALAAMGVLKSSGQSDRVSLTVLGSGHRQYREHLRSLADSLGIADQVNFVDGVGRAEVPTWLEKHDIALFTSVWAEPLARTVMEAMAAGMLVIGSPVGGQAEMLLEGETALTFPPGNAEVLAQQIVYAMEHPRIAQQLAQAGQKLILQRFDLERMLDETETWLLQISSSIT